MHASSSSTVTPPGRSRTGSAPLRSSTVDSTPTLHGPLSSTASIRPASPSSTCRARGRADLARPVGRRRRDRPAHRAQQRQRQWHGRHAHRQRVQPGPGQQRDRTIRPARQHQRQRPRPERLRQPLRALHSPPRAANAASADGVVTDQRIEPRPALGGENRQPPPRHLSHRRPARRPFRCQTRPACRRAAASAARVNAVAVRLHDLRHDAPQYRLRGVMAKRRLALPVAPEAHYCGRPIQRRHHLYARHRLRQAGLAEIRRARAVDP